MAHVGQECLSGLHLPGKDYRIVNQLVGVVGLVKAQGIDHQHLDAFEQGQLVVIDGLHVRDVGKAAEAIAQDGQLTVHHPDGQDVDVADTHLLTGTDFMQSYRRHSWVTMFCKAVGQHLQHVLFRDGISIDIDLSELAVRPYIVHAAYMVIVGMCHEDGVNTSEGLRQYLLTEVRPAVYQQSGAVGLHQDAAAQTVVAGILTATYLTLATDDRYAT